MDIENYMIWIWLGIFVFTVILEAITQDLVSIWFSLGSLASMCVSFGVPYWVEIIVFVVVSSITLIFTRPLVKKLTDRQIVKSNTDEFVGKKVKVVSDVDKYDGGEIKINGIIYTAILPEEESETISKDSIVEIVTIKGNKLVVKKVEEEN
ncbi:MAG: NfeD family protein [Acholeplasmatales bacterium]|nr:NfeD family protein [Acholeplasmatales bacterium]